MKDEDVLRFAPPEIRRLWQRVLMIEASVTEVRDSLRRIEALLESRLK